MVANVKPTGRAISMPAGLALGALVSIAVTLTMAGIIAALAVRNILPESSIGYGVMIVLLSASLSGAIVANVKIKRRKLLVSALSGLIYYVMLLAITAMFFGGQYQAMGVTALMVVAGSLLPVLSNPQGRGSKKRKRYKVSSR